MQLKLTFENHNGPVAQSSKSTDGWIAAQVVKQSCTPQITS